MTTLSSSLNPAALAALTVAETGLKQELAKVTERIIDAYDVATVYAEQLVDEEHKDALLAKLRRSAVNGSYIMGVKTTEDVKQMLQSVTNWQEVITTLSDKKILCLQGELPSEYEAYAAYATIREIFSAFGGGMKGAQALSKIEVRRGYQEKDAYYLSTMLRVPTNIITVQLRTDGDVDQEDAASLAQQVEFMARWFVGREKSSILYTNEGDTSVRCNSSINPKSDSFGQRAPKRPYRPNRDNRQGN